MKSKLKQLNRNLLDAVVMGDFARVSSLLAQDADVDARDEEHQETPLILAAKFNRPDIVRLLVESKASLEAKDDQNRTPIFFATISSNVFDVLLEAGANLQVTDAEGNTILLRRLGQAPSLSDVESLLRLGLDANLRNNAGENALDIAEGLGLIEIAARLRSVPLV
jgi:ankyrin repeat protein